MPRLFDARTPDMLYIHWPFCASKCHYCDFVAMEGHNTYADQYHAALCNEIRTFAADRDTKIYPIQTIFFGGGTPSLYPLSLLKDLFALLHELFDLSQLQECAFEVNPGGQTDEHFEVWRDVGINRLSVGVQVLDDEVLAKMNRHQKTADVHDFFARAPKYINNLSADLIIGLPGVTENVWQETLDAVLSWPITHVSIYFLTIHENTQLYHGVKAGRIRIPKDEQVLALHAAARKQLKAAGFEQYEISNYAKLGFESRHNQGYWQRKTYRGFGLGAASYDGAHRAANQKKLGDYLTTFARPIAPEQVVYSYHETLTPAQQQMEQVMLGLRQRDGIDLHSMVYYDVASKDGAFFSAYKELIADGYLAQSGSRLRLTEKGQIVENEVIVKLCRGLEGDHNRAGSLRPDTQK